MRVFEIGRIMSSKRRRNTDEVFCRHCGEVISVQAEVCPHCGVRNARYNGGSTLGSERSDTTLGLETNITAALAYVLGFVSGIAVYLLEDDEFSRFHAAQSIAVFGGLAVVNVFLGVFTAIGISSVGATLSGLVSLVTLGLWVFLIITAYRGETRRIPLAADVADQLVGGPSERSRTSGTGKSTGGTVADNDALAALRGRYARGEIGEDEFERRLERLLESEHDDRNRGRESPETERSW